MLYLGNSFHCQDCACLVEVNGCYFCDEINKHIEEIEKCPEGIFDHNNDKEFIVPVTWEVCSLIKVKANSAYEAFMKVQEDTDDFPLPEKSSYIDGSFGPSFDTEEMIETYTEMYEKGELRL